MTIDITKEEAEAAIAKWLGEKLPSVKWIAHPENESGLEIWAEPEGEGDTF